MKILELRLRSDIAATSIVAATHGFDITHHHDIFLLDLVMALQSPSKVHLYTPKHPRLSKKNKNQELQSLVSITTGD
jgi:hypothetical protein